jgi:hypothetical protein
MGHGTKRSLSLFGFSLLIVAVGWRSDGLQSVFQGAVEGERPECPHDTITWIDTSGVTHIYDRIPLSGDITGIPEFHDCQRFIKGGKAYGRGVTGPYDSIYAIYAAFHLESLPCGLNRCSSGQVGAVGVPAATVLSYGGHYPWLGLAPGFNCLYLWNPPEWKAAMVSQYDNPDCRYKRTLDPLPAGAVPLPVRVIKPVSVPPLRDREYPPVARWDWDPATQQQFIGIRCGVAWCEIGGPSNPGPAGSGFGYPPDVTFEAIPGLVSSTAGAKAVTLVKGWFDAQFLAERNAVIRPGTLPIHAGLNWGFVVPNPVLGDLVLSDFEGKWPHVATAIVGSEYQSILHFAAGSNKIYLCHGSGCKIPPDSLTCSDNTMSTSWWARIRAPDGNNRYRCVVNRSYPAELDVPGTVRWRWKPDDETNWIKCPSGCCEIH